MRNLLAIFFISVVQFASTQSLVTTIQKGHGEVVKAAKFSPDGKVIATASRDKSIKLWDATNGMEIRSLLGSEHTVNDIMFSSDGKTIASSCADNTASIWDVKTGEQIWKTPPSKDYTTCVALSSNGKWLAVGGYDWTAVVYDLETKDTVTTFEVSPDKGLGFGIDLEFSPDNKYLVVGEDNKTSTVYSTKNWKQVVKTAPTEFSCGGCATLVKILPDNKSIIKGNRHSGFEILELESGIQKALFLPKMQRLKAIDISRDGQLALVAGEDSIHVFEVATQELKGAFKAEVDEINDAVFNPEGNKLLISGNNNRASLWTLKGKLVKEYVGILNDRDKGGINYDPNNWRQSHIARHVKYKNHIQLSQDAKYLLRGKVGKKARLWEVASGKTVMEFIGHEKAVISFNFSKDEKQLLTGGGEGVAKLWDVQTGREMRSFKGHREPIFDVVWSNDQTKMATCAWDGYVIVWDVQSGEILSRIYLGNVAAYNISFTANDVYLIMAKLDKTLELWEIDSQKKVKDFIGHTDIVTRIEWLSQDQFVTTGKEGYSILWNLSSGLIQRKLKQRGPTYALEAYGDDKVFTGGSDRKIHLWNRQGKLLKSIEGHKAEVTSINVNEDKNLLVTGDIDGVIKFWKLDTFEPFFEQIYMGEKDWMVKTNDGSFYATPGALQNIHFTRGMECFELDQFYEEFYTPELLPELFKLRDNSRKKDLGNILEKSPPPIVTFGLAPEQSGDEVELQLKVTDTGGGAKGLQLFHNGKRIDPKSVGLKEVDKGKNYKVYSMKSPLVGGHNVFSAKAYSNQNLASLPIAVDIESTSLSPGSKCYVLAVGINEYQNPKLKLNYAKEDAQAFTKALKEAGSIYADVEVLGLYDKEATQENILNAIEEIKSKIQLNDVFIFYYAGHGSVVDEQFYFIPVESKRLYDGESLEKEAINANTLQDKLKEIKALKQVIIMDACQSGQSVELLAQRGVLEEKAIAQLSRSAGIHVLASAGGDQLAGEYVKLEHGLFTYVLLEGLSGKADAGDGKITIYEIKSYIDDQVPEKSIEYRGKPQYPYSFSRGHDFPIGIVK